MRCCRIFRLLPRVAKELGEKGRCKGIFSKNVERNADELLIYFVIFHSLSSDVEQNILNGFMLKPNYRLSIISLIDECKRIIKHTIAVLNIP